MVPDQIAPDKEMQEKAFCIYSCISGIIPYLKETYHLV